MSRSAAPASNGITARKTAPPWSRDFTKWDDQPVSLQHFAESAVRAYKIAMTPPTMPVLLVADSGLQEDPPAKEPVACPKLTVPRRPGRFGCGG